MPQQSSSQLKNISRWTQMSANNWLLTSREPTPFRRHNRQLQGTWTCCPNHISGVTTSNNLQWNCYGPINSHISWSCWSVRMFRLMISCAFIYLTSIGLVLEYCEPLYPHVLPAYLSEDLKRDQKRVHPLFRLAFHIITIEHFIT